MKKLGFYYSAIVKSLALFIALLISIASGAQQIVAVKDEPRHVPVLQNKFIRIIDARIEDGDTSLFHVHALPSAFVFLTDLEYDNQPLGKPWSKALSKKGMAWYSSFENGPSTHRVGTPAGKRLHAYDIEILSTYGFVRDSIWKPLFADTVFVADKSAGYRVSLDANTPEIRFSGRGPMVAILVSGEEAEMTQTEMKAVKRLKTEDYAYIRPDLQTAVTLKKGTKAELVLFEIR